MTKFLLRKNKIVLSIFLILFLGSLYPLLKKSGSFKLQKSSITRYYIDPKEPKSFQPLSEEAIKALSMPYYYLNKGKQAIAFSSIDDQYVLKIIKWPKKEKKQRYLTTSIHIASEQLSELTAVIAVQYGPYSPQKSLFSDILIMDKSGRMDHLYLDKCLFVLQKKAPYSLKETLLRYYWKQDLNKTHQIIDSFFQLLSAMRSKGVIDLDGSLIRNGNIALMKTAGEEDYRAISIDIGKYALAKYETITQHDLKRLKPFLSWLKLACPDLVPYYLEKVAEYQK